MPLQNDSEELRDRSLRLAHFHEMAKNISYWQREAPKRFMRFDLIKEIKKLQQEAYELGIAHASEPPAALVKAPHPDDPVPWLTLPYTARDAFAQICRFEWIVLLDTTTGSRQANMERDWLCYYDLGEAIEGKERYSFAQRFPSKTISPLIAQNLMQRVDFEPPSAYLEVTERGWATIETAIAQGKVVPFSDEIGDF